MQWTHITAGRAAHACGSLEGSQGVAQDSERRPRQRQAGGHHRHTIDCQKVGGIPVTCRGSAQPRLCDSRELLVYGCAYSSLQRTVKVLPFLNKQCMIWYRYTIVARSCSSHPTAAQQHLQGMISKEQTWHSSAQWLLVSTAYLGQETTRTQAAMPASPKLAVLPELGPVTSSWAHAAAISATSVGSAAWLPSGPGRPRACVLMLWVAPVPMYRAAGLLRGASALGRAAHILSAAASTCTFPSTVYPTTMIVPQTRAYL